MEIKRTISINFSIKGLNLYLINLLLKGKSFH